MKLRHAPLLLVREMARHKSHRGLVADTLAHVIQRADELAEFVAIYWKDGRIPLSGQVKKGLAAAFPKFDEYALAKYDRGGPVKLRDVLFLCHAKPRDAAQASVWKKLIWGRLNAPDTWEVALSSGADKREAWQRLLAENKLGALALLRNLRNMREAGVEEELVLSALRSMSTARVLPFRFLAAARYAPQWEETLEQAMLKCVAGQEKLTGKTIVLVDVSGSMTAPLSRRSEMQRTDAAYGLAVLLREIGEKVSVFSFSDDLVEVPPRRGFALRDAIDTSQRHNSTQLGKSRRKPEPEGEVRSPDRDLGRAGARLGPRTKGQGLHDQRGQLQERRRLRQVDAHRRLERVGRRVHPHVGADGEQMDKLSGWARAESGSDCPSRQLSGGSPTSGHNPKEILTPHRHREPRSDIQKLSPVESGLT
jgi:hypothetical protein